MNIIKRVSLKNFRCHSEFDLDCDRPTTLIIGENGSGKTSILEVIYLALRGKSFKGTDKEILKRDTDYYRAEIELVDAKKIIIRFNGMKKEFEIDGKKSMRLSKKDRYPVALKQRNDLLKEEIINKDDLFSWNVMCANYGAELIKQQVGNLEKINEKMTNTYQNIANNNDTCMIKYLGVVVSENEYLQSLEKNYEKDRILGYTTFGIHRDDYEFVFNNKKADGSASRGENRSMILALKFIEAQILEQEVGKKPVVLLDDIFSELDEVRQKHLIDNFKDYQMIITSTSIPSEMRVDKKL